MDTRQLEYFVAVAESLSFSKAAEKQFVTQTTISYHISSLEKELGVRLLNRNNKQVELTPAGIDFLNRTKAILNELNKAANEARHIESFNGDVLRIGYFGHTLHKQLPTVLEQLVKEYPGVLINVFQKKQSELIHMLEKDDVDCVFCTDYGMFSQITWMKKMSLYADPIRLLVRSDHWAAGRDSVTLNELRRERFALMVEKQLFDQMDFPVPDAEIIFVESHDELMLLVNSGYCISMGAEQAFDKADDRVRLIPFSDYVMYDNNYMCWKGDNRKQVLKDLIKILNCTKM